MNPIEKLKAGVERELPEVNATLRQPRASDGTWWLDLTLGAQRVAVEWGRRGFGLSCRVVGAGYGERPEETFEHVEIALQRTLELLTREPGGYAPPPWTPERGVSFEELDTLTRELKALIGTLTGAEVTPEVLGAIRGLIAAVKATKGSTFAPLGEAVEQPSNPRDHTPSLTERVAQLEARMAQLEKR